MYWKTFVLAATAFTLLLLLVPAPALAVQATLLWSDDGLNPTRVEHAVTLAGPWVNLTPTLLAPGVKSFVQTGLPIAVQNCYRVIKVGTLGDSTPLQGCGTPNIANPATGLTITHTP